jgi:cation diffusion facilitator CzcD-associated flavoprotein CzcO
MTIHELLIVGSGFAGVGLAIKLKEAGHHDFVVLEQAARVGGTWRDNDYPGAACDVPSHLYSFSFAPNPRWTRAYAPQHEILAYLEDCVARFGIGPHLRFGARVVRAVFDEREGFWTVETASGDRYRARVLVTGTGGLSRPALPAIAGLDRFGGPAFHSARWRHDVDLAGKSVAVIGTGASAIQIVPAIAERVGRLVLFQRTPPWILPKDDHPIDPRAHERFRRWPRLQQVARAAIYWRNEGRVLAFAIEPRLMKVAEKEARAHLEASVADPILRAKLTPDYTIGCKRVLISNDYYPALCRPNVEVVTRGIAHVEESAVVDRGGDRHPVDAIVFGTGFHAAEAAAPFEIVGRSGRRLDDTWTQGAEAYLGTVVAGFPNLFVMTGPNTGLGHNSMIFMIESQIPYVLGALRALRRERLRWIDVREEIQARYNRRLHTRLSRTVWATGGCASWYQTSSGKITTLWPGPTFEFRARTARIDLADFERAAR